MAVSDLVMVSMTFTVQIGDAERQLKDMSIHCMYIVYIYLYTCVFCFVFIRTPADLCTSRWISHIVTALNTCSDI